MSTLLLMAALGGNAAMAQESEKPYVSDVWVADLGNGKYHNPILCADYSDPDVCRVGDDYYMTASSFNCLPGLPILHSKDLVNWTIIGHAVAHTLPPVETPERPEHGNRVWAPAIRHHNGTFYIFWGDPDQGAYMVSAKDPRGTWTAPKLIKPAKGLIDTCPLWDDDGKVYLYHAYAGSRAGLKSILAVCELDPETLVATTQSRIIFDGHIDHPTCEGAKIHKYNGKYYFSYSTGDSHYLCYAIGDTPYGPFKFQGVILDPVVGWTTHHSIVEYKGEWYLFYHDCVPSNDTTWLRSLKVQKLYYNEDGTIQKVKND